MHHSKIVVNAVVTVFHHLDLWPPTCAYLDIGLSNFASSLALFTPFCILCMIQWSNLLFYNKKEKGKCLLRKKIELEKNLPAKKIL